LEVSDLVPVEMKDRQYGPIRRWIKKSIAAPGRRERPRFGFAVADHTRDDQIRVIARSSKSVREGIPKFAAFMD
jgi:hypothetical protein